MANFRGVFAFNQLALLKEPAGFGERIPGVGLMLGLAGGFTAYTLGLGEDLISACIAFILSHEFLVSYI